MSLAELPEWLEWWLISLLPLAWCGIALAVALVIAGAVSLRERAPRPTRQEPARAEPTTLARMPAQRAPERGRRRVPCAPGEPCGLHHDAVCVASACCDRYCPTADPGHAAPVATLQEPAWRIFEAVIEARAAAWRRSGELVAVEMSRETVDDLVQSTPPMKTVDKIMGLPIIVNDSLSRGRVVGRPKDPTADRPVIDPEQTP